jgi:hypothetical protein
VTKTHHQLLNQFWTSVGKKKKHTFGVVFRQERSASLLEWWNCCIQIIKKTAFLESSTFCEKGLMQKVKQQVADMSHSVTQEKI